jgi:shikimate dehydrogenase
LSGSVAGIADSVVAGAFCYDMGYGTQTAFCRFADAAGAAAVVDGLGMLVEQAALAFSLWRGKMPDAGAVLEALRAADSAVGGRR